MKKLTKSCLGGMLIISPMTSIFLTGRNSAKEDIENGCREMAVKLFGGRDYVRKTIKL